MNPTNAPLLEVRRLKKKFAAPVLQGLDFKMEAGEIHALVGSNGAGKSTLARILAGLLLADDGELLLNGQSYQPSSRIEAQRHGVTLMLQELNVFPTLSVAENLFLYHLPAHFGFINQNQLRKQARAALARVGLADLDPGLSAGALGIGQQQMVELAAALAEQCRLLILDEPTAALTARETATLFDNFRRLRTAGVGVLYISHRMDELREIADRVTVLRDGQNVFTSAMHETTAAELVRHMAGHDLLLKPQRSPRKGAMALRVQHLQAGKAVRDVSLELHSGEILGMFGLVGSGRTETLRAIFGADAHENGTIELGEPSRKVHFRKPTDAVRAGLGLVPEDRKQEALLLPHSVRANITLSTLSQSARAGFLDAEREDHAAIGIVNRLNVRCQTIGQPVSELSGGNQQKIVIGRWLLRNCPVLLLDEPTRGVDAAAKDAIHTVLRELADAGKALLVVSGELTELMSLCDRIIVMSYGRTVAEFRPDEWTHEKLTKAAFSGYLTTNAQTG